MPRFSFLTFLLICCLAATTTGQTSSQEYPRAITADDFTKARPKSKPSGRRGKPKRRSYRFASAPQTGSSDNTDQTRLQFGLTIWKLQPQNRNRYGPSEYRQDQWLGKRVEADTEFRVGDLLRLSIESPRPGYLYIIDSDWYADGTLGETNLIFPRLGENNILEPGKLIDIPAHDQPPFRASPKANQAGESLIFIVTATPIPLPVYQKTLPISESQLMIWKESWGAFTERLELNGGAGQARTLSEQRAAASMGARQLTREDPGPQTIFLLTPRSSRGFLFNLNLSYIR
ncbi:MAG TPA: DUF4384 domain-containing protein [Pyrinomonadaceae bacterium]